MYKQRLELDWVGKDDEPRLEPRILLEDKTLGYGKVDSSNILIHGDNLLALKALEQDYVGKVQLCFIDPPYNKGSAFAHYDDGIEHSLWLSLMRDRLVILKRLLAVKGSLWITIDDNESHYLKVLCDEIFGRHNFITNIVWQKKYTVANDAKWFSESHDHILVYAKNKEIWRPNRLPRSDEMNERYRNPDLHPNGPWKATPLYAKRRGSEKEQKFAFKFKNGYVWTPPAGTSPRFPANTLKTMDNNNEIWFGVDGTAQPSRKTFLQHLKISAPPSSTIWTHEEVGHNHEAREEVKAINNKDPFATPKPERLLKRILEIATAEGDIVLDPFAGSGTTGSVAHKMGRKWIMVEIGQHCFTHIPPRLKRVIDGEDTSRLAKDLEWKGGGSYRFFTLAPSLLQKDLRGNWIISPQYDAAMLAHAVCNHEGFKFWPDSKIYWKQGHSSEKDFIFVTTEFLTAERLDKIASQLKPDESLLICAKAFKVAKTKHQNITIKKIPQMLLGRCEFGKDDYSLNIKEPYQADLGIEEVEMGEDA